MATPAHDPNNCTACQSNLDDAHRKALAVDQFLTHLKTLAQETNDWVLDLEPLVENHDPSRQAITHLYLADDILNAVDTIRHWIA